MAFRLFEGLEGTRLAGDTFGDGPPVLLLHGGGQTRGSWRKTALRLAERGYRAITFDARGHGDSAWVPNSYGFDMFAEDLLRVIDQVGGRPVLIGASLGGITSLIAIGRSPAPIASALVLVDITTRIDPGGSRQIRDFMTANPEGFESVEQAAAAVSHYMTDRPRPADVSGLRRNLRERGGRLHWHWDPSFIVRAEEAPDFDAIQSSLDEAAARVTVPTLLVRGQHSRIVNDAGVARIQELIAGIEVIEVPGAGHMVAGDANTPFADAVIGFLDRVYPVDPAGSTGTAGMRA